MSGDRFNTFIDLLRRITPQRSSIVRVLAFCMDNASCAEHIVCILRDSICGDIPYLRSFQQPIEGISIQSKDRDDDSNGSNDDDHHTYHKEGVCGEATVILARVYVVNDLLYNADNGKTTPYRTLLQVRLNHDKFYSLSVTIINHFLQY